VSIKANGASVVGDIFEAKEANNLLLFISAGIMCMLSLLLPFSLTKYSAIFAEAKGCYGKNNNQLAG
jgi:hypothetical protein